MGQYFKIVNEDKKEVINPWDLGGTAKFWEWLWNPQARVFVWLLRKSDEGGGGDINATERFETLGRWAGDRITLVGDYDSSNLGIFAYPPEKVYSRDYAFFADWEASFSPRELSRLNMAIIYRITLSAWMRIDGGIVRPRALAVLRLTTNSNFAGCSTGRPAGLAPLRILST